MNQRAYALALDELATLETKCRDAFDRGSASRGIESIQWSWEYHRLSELRREARGRLAAYRAQQPANDVSEVAV